MRNFLTILCLFFAGAAFAQSPLIMPIPQQQFFTSTGTVCSGCSVYTYLSGTYTPWPTYTDYTGLYTNTNPIVLNSAGFPQTSIGTQVGIWLSPVITYRIVVKNAANVQLYQVDGITGQLPGTIANPLTIQEGTCPQLIVGPTGFQTSLCFPVPTTNIVLSFPNSASDTLVARNTVDTLTNKTIASPIISSPAVTSGTFTSPQITNAIFPCGSGSSGTSGNLNIFCSSADNLLHQNVGPGTLAIVPLRSVLSSFSDVTTTNTLTTLPFVPAFSAAASTSYALDCEIFFVNASGLTGFLNFSTTGPSSPTEVVFSVDGPNNTSAPPQNYVSAAVLSFGTPIDAIEAISGNQGVVHLRLGLANGANGGTVGIQVSSSNAGWIIKGVSYCTWH